MKKVKSDAVGKTSTDRLTAFAGALGSMMTETVHEREVAVSACVHDAGGGVLLGPDGRWAVDLVALNPALGTLLMRVLHDLSTITNPTDATLGVHISAYDKAAANDSSLDGEIRSGLIELDALAHRMMGRGYDDIAERSLRRSLLMQMAHHPLFERLGIGHTVPALASVG